MANDKRRSGLIPVEVAYGTAEKQRIIPLQVPSGTTALEAARQSGIAEEFAGLDLERSPMGVFSRPLNGKRNPPPDQYILQEGDRLEIYRPLQIDPMQARRRRAAPKP